MTTVTIIADFRDQDAQLLQPALKSLGVSANWLRLSQDQSMYDLDWRLGQDPRLRVSGTQIDLAQTPSAVFFKSTFLSDPPWVMMGSEEGSDAALHFATREWNAALRSFVELFYARSSEDGTAWLNPPHVHRLTDLKPYLLSQARVVGCQVPWSSFSTGPLLDPPPGQLVGKAVNKYEFLSEDVQYVTTVLDGETRNQLLEARSPVPNYVQEFLPQVQRELRIYSVGLEHIGVLLKRQPGVEDIRTQTERQLDAEIVTVDPEIARKIGALMATLDIAFCVTDFCLTDDGPVLVDVTPDGCWFWLGPKAEGVARAVAEALTDQYS